MSLPTAAGPPLKVVRKPIFTSFCWAPAAFAASANIVDPRKNRCSIRCPPPVVRRSMPKPLRREVSTLPHGFEFLPHDRGMHFRLVEGLRGESAVRSGHDILAPYQLGEADQPFGDPFWMLDNVAGMGDDAGAQHFAWRQFHVFEQVILVLVARVGGLEAERARSE